MTGLLKDTLTERAATAHEPPLDLDAIIQTGNTRIRRRRATAVAAIAIVCVLILAGSVVATVHIAEPAQPATVGVPSFKERRPTFATDHQIHFGSDTIEVGPEKLVSFVQTDEGFVYTGVAGNVYFTNAQGNGRSDFRIGTGNYRRELATDDTGTVVGWVDESINVPSQYILFDVAVDREIARIPTGNPGNYSGPEGFEPRVVAIDNDQAYLSGPEGLSRLDIATGKVTVLKAGLGTNALVDAANGRLAYVVDTGGNGSDGPAAGLAMGPTIGSTKVLVPGETTGSLAPDGKHFFGESGNEDRLFDADGHPLALDTEGHEGLFFSVWLDDDRFTAVGRKALGDADPLDLMVCSVSTATCSTAIAAFAPHPPDNGIPRGWLVPIGKAFTPR